MHAQDSMNCGILQIGNRICSHIYSAESQFKETLRVTCVAVGGKVHFNHHMVKLVSFRRQQFIYTSRCKYATGWSRDTNLQRICIQETVLFFYFSNYCLVVLQTEA